MLQFDFVHMCNHYFMCALHIAPSPSVWPDRSSSRACVPSWRAYSQRALHSPLSRVRTSVLPLWCSHAIARLDLLHSCPNDTIRRIVDYKARSHARPRGLRPGYRRRAGVARQAIPECGGSTRGAAARPTGCAPAPRPPPGPPPPLPPWVGSADLTAMVGPVGWHGVTAWEWVHLNDWRWRVLHCGAHTQSAPTPHPPPPPAGPLTVSSPPPPAAPRAPGPVPGVKTPRSPVCRPPHRQSPRQQASGRENAGDERGRSPALPRTRRHPLVRPFLTAAARPCKTLMHICMSTSFYTIAFTSKYARRCQLMSSRVARNSLLSMG